MIFKSIKIQPNGNIILINVKYRKSKLDLSNDNHYHSRRILFYYFKGQIMPCANKPSSKDQFPISTIQTVLVSSLLTVSSINANEIDTPNGTIEHIVINGERANDLNAKDTTATKMDVSVKEIGRSLAIMDDKELEVRAIKDVKEAFNYVAGFRGNGPADRTYTARGLRTSIDNVMVDGLRSMQGGEGGTGSRLPSTFNADNTTFLRGPEALLYGAGVAGGLVNITTKKPNETAATTLGISNRSYVSSDTGNFKRNDTSFNLDSTGPLAGENVLYRILAQHTPSGDHFQEGRKLEETLIDASLSFLIADHTIITPKIEYADRFKTGGSSYADGVFESNFASGEIRTYGKPVNKGHYYGSNKDKGENTTESASIAIEHDFNDNWSGSAKYRTSSTESESLDLYISDSSVLQNAIGKDEVNRKWVYSKGDDSYQLFDIGIQGKTKIAGLEHHILFGYNFRDLDIKFARAFQSSEDAVGKNTISASNPNEQIIGQVPEDLMDVSIRPRNQKDTNIYLKDRIKVTDETTLVGGLAYIKQEQQEMRSDNTYTGNYSDTIWDLGIVHALNKDVNIFATYSRAYEPVNVRWIAQYGQGNADFKAVEGNNYEAGIKADMLLGDLSTAVTIFALDRTNSTKFVRNENGWLLTQLDGKSFESKGLEIDTTYYFNDSFNTSLSYAFTRAHDTVGNDEGIQANNTPKHSAALWNTYVMNTELSFSLGLRYEGERFDGDYILPSYVELDAGAYYQEQDWKLSLVLNNAFDKNRAEAGANWVTVQPNAPRSLNLNLSYTF